MFDKILFIYSVLGHFIKKIAHSHFIISNIIVSYHVRKWIRQKKRPLETEEVMNVQHI